MVVTVIVSLWACAFVCFALAFVFGLAGKNTGRLNLVALGLAFAALAHLWPGR